MSRRLRWPRCAAGLDLLAVQNFPTFLFLSSTSISYGLGYQSLDAAPTSPNYQSFVTRPAFQTRGAAGDGVEELGSVSIEPDVYMVAGLSGHAYLPCLCYVRAILSRAVVW